MRAWQAHRRGCNSSAIGGQELPEVPIIVMAGLVPAIHVFSSESRSKDVDARD
jgi:hypothetical protein